MLGVGVADRVCVGCLLQSEVVVLEQDGAAAVVSWGEVPLQCGLLLRGAVLTPADVGTTVAAGGDAGLGISSAAPPEWEHGCFT